MTYHPNSVTVVTIVLKLQTSSIWRYFLALSTLQITLNDSFDQKVKKIKIGVEEPFIVKNKDVTSVASVYLLGSTQL